MSDAVVSQSASPAPLNERSFRLFTYLRELTALNLARVTDLAAYDRVVWLSDVPDNDHCFSIIRGAKQDGDDSTWLEIKKRSEPKFPVPPTICDGWYSLSHIKRDDAVPSLHDRIPVKQENTSRFDPPEFIELSERPSVSRAWQTYIEGQWKPWSQAHQEWRTHHEFYSSLFTIEQQVKRLGEAYELFLGIGLLTWISPSGERVRRHLIAARALLSFDSISGTISLRAAGEGAKPTLEYDMLDPESRPEPKVIKACEEMVVECGEDVFGIRLRAPLKSWVNAMSDRGVFSESNNQPDSLNNFPAVNLAPALVLRRRTRRSLVTFLKNIAEHLKDMESEKIPFGVRRLVEIVGEHTTSQETETAVERSSRLPTAEREIFFPLLSNEEQRHIVQRLRGNKGVLVQGPPGTGKSQTIANLICHLPASGQRILITSQTERALKVLQSKLPEELQALCVTVLGADETALKNMERSVLGINERQTNWDAVSNTQTIRKLEQELKVTRDSKAKAETRLRQLREMNFQTYSIIGGEYGGTAGAIAQRLETEKQSLGWIDDSIPEATEAPITEADFRLLCETLISIPVARRQECRQNVAIPTAIPTVEAFLECTRAERTAKEKLNEYAAIEARPNTKQLAIWTREERQTLRAQIDSILSQLSETRRTAADWTIKALDDCLSGRAKPWFDLLALMRAELDKLVGKIEKAYEREIHLPERDRTIIRGDAEGLLEHFRRGGGLGWGPFRSKPVKQALYIVREARVNGRLCDSVLIVEELVEHLYVERTLDTLWSHCSAHRPRVLGNLRAQLSEIEQFVQTLEQVSKYVSAVDKTRSVLRTKRGLSEPAWNSEDSLSAFLDEIHAAEARCALSDSQQSFRQALSQLEPVMAKPNAHPSVAKMIDALKTRAAAQFGEAHVEMAALLQDRQLWDKVSALADRLRKPAPILTAELEVDPVATKWLNRRQVFAASWSYARANTWLKAFIGGMDAASAEVEIRRCDAKIANCLESLASCHAWKHCLSRLTESQRQHMIAWKDAIKRIGKGTGIRANLHRQHAREHMEECRSAIPAWIMPFYRIAETIGDDPEPYDVVIVDEASQSGPEACALMYLAKRCIIVGDDKQISPEAVGIERKQVDQLTEQYLFDIEHSDSFGAESSLFSQAQIRFGGRIRLREHFRCMPEIIRFSNDLCYQDEPLLPLRQYTASRLSPIEVRHVPGGLREGEGSRVRNDVEAQAVVEQIVSCIQDPRYAGKTMGVISLLGEMQAEHIREMVVSRVEAREIEEREFTFGDAYAFQGDERDIIFLSMVAAPNVRNATLASGKAEQRFNVAASRARDQIWLFHSVTLEDLNTTDVRYRLLSYYQSPEAPPTFDPDWSKCDSKFEETVGRIIHGKGYRIIPQYEPFGKGGKRLDFVVEGMQAKLAIECDGDAFHTAAEDVHNDLVRQRQLERCGWRFWRISDSEFYSDREKSLEPLWQLLEQLGISPYKKEDEPEVAKPAAHSKAPTEPPPVLDTPIVARPERPIVVPRDRGVVEADSKPAMPKQAEMSFGARPQLEPLERLLLDILNGAKRMETQSLTLEVVRRLSLGADGRRSVETALKQLEKKALIRSGVNYVERSYPERPRSDDKRQER